MGGVEELISFAESMIAPPFDRSEDDKTNWADIARQECEVRWTETTLASTTALRRIVDACDIPLLIIEGDDPETTDRRGRLSTTADRRYTSGSHALCVHT